MSAQPTLTPEAVEDFLRELEELDTCYWFEEGGVEEWQDLDDTDQAHCPDVPPLDGETLA